VGFGASAGRIAIMKDGAIIQIGTPEDLATGPAADYVAGFTKDIPRAIGNWP